MPKEPVSSPAESSVVQTPTGPVSLSAEDFALFREELAAARAERVKQAGEIEKLQKQLETQARAPAAAAHRQHEPPAWAKPEDDQNMVDFLIHHGDQPRGAVLHLGPIDMLAGIRHLYFFGEDGRIASVQCTWSDLRAH